MKSGCSIEWKTVFGFAAAFGMLALSTPGVKVVRAEDPEPAEAQVCEGSDESSEAFAHTDPAFSVAMLLERLRREQAAGQHPADAPVALNNRGNSYGPPPIRLPPN